VEHLTLLDQRRIRDIQRALDVPEERWASQLADLEAGILAGQSLDDLGEVLNEWAMNAVDTLLTRYAAAKAASK
jgi:hypothetical protein